ncbi:iron-containing redox enzyme family protein [Sorangium sp. So ce429]
MTISQFQYTHMLIPAEPESALDSWVGEMLATNDLESLLDSNTTIRTSILNAARNVAHRAFVESEPAALLAAHRTLYRLYEQNVRTPANAVLVNQFDPTLVQIRRILERAWECRERSRLTFSRGNLSGPEQFLSAHRRMLDNHRVRTHPLSDYLADEATSADFALYVTSSGLLNLRFFDLIALALVGLTTDQMRREIVDNLVDENADPGTKSHTSLVLGSMNSTGYTTDPDEVAGSMGWEALAGYNVFFLLGINRRLCFEYLGALGASEALDPDHNEKVIKGLQRTGLSDTESREYFQIHVDLERAHGSGWLDNVTLSAVTTAPEMAAAVLAGAEIRLNTCADFYDATLARFRSARRATAMAHELPAEHLV